jgi:hypothetical protein
LLAGISNFSGLQGLSAAHYTQDRHSVTREKSVEARVMLKKSPASDCDSGRQTEATISITLETRV